MRTCRVKRPPAQPFDVKRYAASPEPLRKDAGFLSSQPLYFAWMKGNKSVSVVFILIETPLDYWVAY